MLLRTGFSLVVVHGPLRGGFSGCRAWALRAHRLQKLHLTGLAALPRVESSQTRD